jgi:uncharacterized membrane protein
VLVLVNTLSVNLAGLLTLWYTGYRPRNWFETADVQRKLVRNVVVFAAAVLLLSAFLGAVTVSSYQASTYEQQVNDDVEELVAQPEYEEMMLLDVEASIDEQTTYEQADPVVFTDDIQHVTVTIGYTAEGDRAALADEIHERVNAHVDYEVSVEVRFIEVERR